MALIQVGSFDDIAKHSFTIVPLSDGNVAMEPGLLYKKDDGDSDEVITIEIGGLYQKKEELFEEIMKNLPIGVDKFTLKLATSKDKRGITLQSIKIEGGFSGFFKNLFNIPINIYFVAWAYDFSGKPVEFYPGKNAEPSKHLIPVKSGEIRQFLGDGINLFNKREVTGGIELRVQIWSSSEGARSRGEVLSEIANTLDNSQLNTYLSLLSAVSGDVGALMPLIFQSSTKLAAQVGEILKIKGDQFVDFFVGYYAVDKEWAGKIEQSTGPNAEITLIHH